MRVLLIVLLVLFAEVGAVSARRRRETKVATEGNHTVNETTKGKIYPLKDLVLNAPLAIVLKNKGDASKFSDEKLDNPVNVTITDDADQKVECQLNHMNEMCLLKKVKSARSKVEITCKQQPCDVLFDPFQSEYHTAEIEGKPTSLQVLYNINRANTIVEIKCNDSSVTNLKDKLGIYSDSQYEVINLGNLVFVVFSSKVNDIAVLTTDAVRKCSQISFFENTQSFEYGKAIRAIVPKTKKFSVSKIPTKQLRVDMAVTNVAESVLKNFTVQFLGVPEGKSEETSIHKFLTGDPDQADQDPSVDINLILKANLFTNYKNFSIKITSSQNLLVVVQLNDEVKHQIDVEQQSYFSLEKDEKIQYKILNGQTTDKNEAILVDAEPKQDLDLKLSETPCLYSKGCTLTVTAKTNTQATIFTSLTKTKAKEVNYIQLNSSLTLTLNEGQTKYLINNRTAKSRLIRVSSQNVIVYAAGEKCPQPSPSCYQFSGNVQKVISIQNTTGPLYIAVQGLELVKFTIFVTEGQGTIQLLDGVPMPINMQKDKEIYLKFKIESKKTVNFNLIAPLNTFSMYIANSEEKPDSEDVDLATSSSFIKFEQNDIDGLVFTILVKRIIDKQNENFVLIASTSKATLILDRSEPHYDILQPDQSRKFAFLINPKDIDDKIQTILSVSIFQRISGDINLTAVLSGPNNSVSKQTTLAKRDNIIDVNQYADEICDSQDTQDQCDIFVTITNNHKDKLDITLTLLTNNSIIELKPGIWQRFQMTSLTSSNHFYFFPTNKKYPVTIQFTHSFGAYRISFVLWNDELKTADAGSWPFPEVTDRDSQTPTAHTGQYVIHPDQIAKCFPNCIVLISLWNAAEKPNPDPNVVAPLFNNFGSYTIMATDNIIEVAEEQKITISLAKNETKYLLVSITPFLETDKVLTFMCSDVIGYHSFTASLSSNKNLSLPNQDEFDYRLELYQTQFKMEDIKKKLEEKGMDTHTEIDIILYAKGFDANKFVFEFTSRQNYMKSLSLGVPESVSLAANTTRGYLVDYFMSYRVKLLRRRGFPYLSYKACKRNKIPDCLDELSKLKPIQVTSKAEQFRERNCDFCVLVISVQAKTDPIELDLIALADFAVVQLNQGQITTDFAIANETNQYKIASVKGSDIAITVTVFQGQPTVTVQNSLQGINITGKRSGNLIHIVIPSSTFSKKPQQHQTFFQSYALSSAFSEVTIKVKDIRMNCSYSISYTIGERHIDILDGVLVSSSIRGNESVSYSYHNWQNSTAIVSVTYNDSEMLENCEITIYSSNGSEEREKTKPQKMQIKKRTPKPSLTFSLNESFTDYEIKLTNKHSKQILFNLTINHVDIVLLPFGYEYPSSLYLNQSAYFIVEVFNDGYIEFTIKKCSDSDLTFSYALDDDSFEKEEFAYSTDIEETKFTSFVHVKASTIYLKINSQNGLLYSIKAAWFAAKKDVPKETIKPGNKGLMDYTITGSQEFLVSFTPIVCTTPHCPKAEYFYLMSTNRDQVVSQTECPGSFFLFTAMKSLKHEKVKPQKGQNNTSTFKIKIPPEVNYLGLKAVLENGQQITYNVIEVSTIWSSLAKNRSYHLGMLGMLLFCCFICCCMRIRKLIRETREKGKYAGLPQVE